MRLSGKVAVIVTCTAISISAALSSEKGMAEPKVQNGPITELNNRYSSFGRGLLPFDAVILADGRIVVVGRGGLLSVLSADESQPATRVNIGAKTDLLAAALGPDGLVRVTDGAGIIWRLNTGVDAAAREAESAAGTLFGIQYTTDGTGIAVGEFGSVFINAPGAPEWRRAEFDWKHRLPELVERVGDVAPHLYRVCAHPNGGALIVGEYGVVIEYQQGQWQVAQAAPDSASLFACMISPAGLQIVAGQSGKLFSRSAASETWNAIELPVKTDIYDLAGEAERFLAVGQGAAVYNSADGKHWQALQTARPLPGTEWIVRALPVKQGTMLLSRDGYLLLDDTNYARITDAPPRAASHSPRRME